MTTETFNTERMLPILIYIQFALDQDLSLARIAERAGVSPFHFHRIFQQTIGETLKEYTLRLRLEQAAYSLLVHNASVLDIALSVGFQSHESFTRAFKRKFQRTPRNYRNQGFQVEANDVGNDEGDMLNKYTDSYTLSGVKVQELNPFGVAFIRNIGPYVDVDVTLFDQLIEWAKAKGVYNGKNLLIGIGHDAPGITPLEKLRFDACIQVPASFTSEGTIAYQTIPAGTYAMARYIGPYGEVMEAAYAEMVGQIMELERWEFVGLPAIEIYQTTRINPNYRLNHTDIYLPVRKPSSTPLHTKL